MAPLHLYASLSIPNPIPHIFVKLFLPHFICISIHYESRKYLVLYDRTIYMYTL